MRHTLKICSHALLLALSVVPLLAAAAALGVFTAIAVLADRIRPDARFGNCFTFAAARWGRYGGYVTMRKADHITLFGLPFPHAIWQAELGGPMRMTNPVRRRKGRLPWWGVLFRYRISSTDAPRPQTYADSAAPAAWIDP